MIVRRQLKQDQSALLWASIATLVCWFVPILNYIALPLEYLNAHTHEFCHALVGILTGGRVLEINVHADGSGVTPFMGGIVPVVASAGYVGASIIGVLIILFSHTPQGARWSLRVLGVTLLASSLLWVRAHDSSDWIGLVAGYGWVAILFALAWLLPARWVPFAATFIGVQQCLHSVFALLTLMQISMYSQGMSDATLMQQSTHIPATIWAVTWSLFSLFLMGITVRGAFRKSS
jgi:hypothetical protein